MDWHLSLEQLQAAIAQSQQVRADLEKWETEAAAAVAKYLRAEGGVELDPEAIKATLTRPYTLIPIDEHEARLIHWRGVKLPIFGYVEKQEAAFTISRVSRSMDLLTPFPAWMKQELGWKPPAHKAVLDSSRSKVLLVEGEEGTFKKRYGAQLLGSRQEDGTYKIRGGDAWIKLVAALIKDGILPYVPQPVSLEHWDARTKSEIQLRDYQKPTVDEFLAKGALLINHPPGAGKSYVTLYILAHFRGRVLLLADTVIATEQWANFIKEYAPGADVTISTYQGAGRYADREFDLVIFDEAHRVPANTFSKLAFLKTKYRLGLTGTPWREDDRQFMITALSGFPAAIRWSELIRAGILKRPRVIVSTVKDEAAKTAYVKQLIARRRPGRALIFCDWIEQGNALANSLQVSFVHGETAHKLEQVKASDVCVVSRIADTSLDFPDLTLVVEYAFMGGSRTQEAQRLGRLLHGQARGEHYLLFTPEEAQKYRNRLLGVETELLGEVDIEYETVGTVAEAKEKAVRIRPRKPSASGNQPQSDVDIALTNPAVRKLVDAANAKAWPGRDYVARVIRLCWDSPVSVEELRVGKALQGRALTAYKSALREGQRVGLITNVGGDRYLADRAKIKKLVELSGRFKR